MVGPVAADRLAISYLRSVGEYSFDSLGNAAPGGGAGIDLCAPDTADFLYCPALRDWSAAASALFAWLLSWSGSVHDCLRLRSLAHFPIMESCLAAICQPREQ